MCRFYISLLSLALLYTATAEAQNLKPKKRADSFFGIHFDFHASLNDTLIGKTLTHQMIDSFLVAVKPDFIQVDTKGHPGISSYPTKAGSHPAKFVADPLKMFRQATAKRGVGLYSHYSGIMDAKAVADHPDWARIDINGKANKEAVSLFSPYVNQILIPQLKELSDYGINGLWADGDCWAVQNDISAPALAAYTKSTGRTFDPATADERSKEDLSNFSRSAFRAYLNKYTTAIHRYDPNFQVASNWSFTSFMPGPVDPAIDYISGDAVSDDAPAVNFETRCIAPQGKPWDLMVWGFMSGRNGHGFHWKRAEQLKSGAAKTISQGGGFQIYIPQRHDASLQLQTIPVLKEVADFCRERQAFSFKTTPVPQVALLMSAYAHNKETKQLFSNNDGGNDKVKGLLSLLLDAGYSTEILQEHHLKTKLGKYPLLVIPEWNELEPAVITQLKVYVKNGGHVLVIGQKTTGMFADVLSTAVVDSSNMAHLNTRIMKYGTGDIAGIYNEVSKSYAARSDSILKASVAKVIEQIFPEPIAKVNGEQKIHLTVNKKDKSTMLHLVSNNVNYKWIDDGLHMQLTPIQNIALNYRSAIKPKTVFLEPGHQPLTYTYSKGETKITVPKLDIYSIVVIR